MIKKNILISAYACEPNKGSEPGVGWNWAIELIRLGHNVKIITRSNNQNSINKLIKTEKKLKRNNFFYYDLPKFFLFFKNKIPFGVQIYYYLWQIFLYKNLKKQKFINNYQIIHHLTLGSVRLPSFLWKLKKKFIFGPVGGFEFDKKTNIKKTFKFKDRLYEIFREKLTLFMINYNKDLKNCYKNSDLILSRNNLTKKNLQNYFKKKILVSLDVASSDPIKTLNKKKESFKFLFVGRFYNWKGGDVLIDAFYKAIKKDPKLVLHFYGNGPELKNWSKKITKLGLENNIKIIGFIDKKKLNRIYQNYNVLILPTFHDSGCSAIMEALSFSLPVICLNIGGPGDTIDKSCGIKISINSKTSKNKIINQLSNSIIRIKHDKNFYKKLVNGAYNKAKSNTWSLLVKKTYSSILDYQK